MLRGLRDETTQIPGPASSLVCFPMKALRTHSSQKGQAGDADADGGVFVFGRGMAVGTFVCGNLALTDEAI